MDIFRQTLKAIFTNTTPNYSQDNKQVLHNNHVHRRGIEIRENDKCNMKLNNKVKKNTSQMVQTTEVSLNDKTRISRKRPSRPSKAGPSKKQKKQSPSSIYLGKLSNFIRNRYDSDSDY